MNFADLVVQPAAWGVVTLGLGLWLLLPRGSQRGWWLGLVLACASLGLFAARLPLVGDWLSNGVFHILAATTLVAAVMTITLRNPVYCAIWFALSLLGTAGLFFLQGSQFLGVATVVVYAGAILVTFLFVLMLAQPEGHAFYDRLSWEASLSAATGAVLIGLLTFALSATFHPPEGGPRLVQLLADRSKEILADEHMAHLGRELFSKHLISVEVAGTLLLVALVGTVAIIAESKVKRGKSGGAR